MITDTLLIDTVAAAFQQVPVDSIPLSNIIPEKAGFNFDLVRLLRGLMGMAVLVAIAYVFSNNRKAVNWKMVGTGLLFQLILAVGILYIPFVQVFFEFIGKGFVKILAFTNEGVTYLLKRNDTGTTDPALQNFAFSILPTIIFFAAFSSLLFYLGVIQIFVKGFGYLLSRGLGLSGPESLSVAGNIFLGQTESPLLIKPYLEKMSKSEILLVMSGGMATLAGGVLAAYIGFLGGGDPVQQ
ncbi:MAG: Na+ dependent nucleoside transporter N-terminal domain-containing protein, partial [Bacteroidota bacterium]|nr:Na+ dependent nucleoside transporter N-terminal domain-containing protein [Bacteroidota bacterium]